MSIKSKRVKVTKTRPFINKSYATEKGVKNNSKSALNEKDIQKITKGMECFRTF